MVVDPDALVASLEATWLARADARVQARSLVHVTAMVTKAITDGVIRPVDDSVSDGYHTFGELYRHRMLLNAALFTNWAAYGHESFEVHKSLLHHDGEAPFGGGWFIVVAQLPTGQISYHYQLEHWDLFSILERERAAPWDGHSSEQAADRLQRFLEGDES